MWDLETGRFFRGIVRIIVSLVKKIEVNGSGIGLGGTKRSNIILEYQGNWSMTKRM